MNVSVARSTFQRLRREIDGISEISVPVDSAAVVTLNRALSMPSGSEQTETLAAALHHVLDVVGPATWAAALDQLTLQVCGRSAADLIATSHNAKRQGL